ncbi:MAG: FAD-dependent oxidoreductase [Betaproteobacteria bacterium]|nr:FAD-dependent oxidoreductase [Betaproteobacteria bacterium]
MNANVAGAGSAQTEVIAADVVVVGGGGSGLMAACQARIKGARVLVLEKGERVGGTTALSVGSIMAAGSRLQRAAGIEDNPEHHAEDLAGVVKTFGIGDNPALRALFAAHAAEAVDFLEAIGVVFTDPMAQPPHRKPRLHQIIPGSRSYIHHLERHSASLGVEVRCGMRATRLLQEGGRVSGVEAQSADGRLLRATAGRAVVLASGDVAGDPDMLKQYAGAGLENVEVFNPVCTGDGHAMAAAIGAKIVPRLDFGAAGLANIRFIPPTKPNWVQRIPPHRAIARIIKLAMRHLPDALLRPFVLKFLTTALGPDRRLFENGFILVNRNGERFADELGGPNFNDVGSRARPDSAGDKDSRAPSLLLARQPEGIGYLIFDDSLARKFSVWPNFVSTAPGVAYAYVDDYRKARADIFHSGNTLAELSAKVGFDASKLEATIVAANGRCSGSQQPLATAPFHALGPVKSWVLVTPVGLAVNDRLEVLDEQGGVIRGLYAAGGVGQGGYSITGHGHGLGWAFTSGMLAGRAAAAL